MKKILTILTLTIVSCRPPSYYPSQQIMPQLKRAGNVQLAAGLGSNMEYLLQASGSPVKGIGLYLGAENIISGNTSRKHTNYEGGVGYYINTASKTHYSLYAGYSMGKVNARNDNKYVKNNFNRYTCTFTYAPYNKGWNVSTSIRGDYNQMRNYQRYEIINGNKKTTSSGDRSRLFVGPSVGATILGKSGNGFQAQFGSAIPMERSTLYKSILSMYFYASAYLFFDVDL